MPGEMLEYQQGNRQLPDRDAVACAGPGRTVGVYFLFRRLPVSTRNLGAGVVEPGIKTEISKRLMKTLLKNLYSYQNF